MHTILSTKISPPRLSPDLLMRQRLFARFETAWQQRQIVLVAASAGYGKSTVIASCLTATAIPAGWLALDTRDNDPARFWAQLLAALDNLVDDTLQNLTPRDALQLEDAFTALIMRLEDTSPYILVLDDLHFIDNPVLENVLNFFAENCPPNLHLVISSRIDPTLRLSRLRASGKLIEIREAELRFSQDETDHFLRQQLGYALDPESLHALYFRTEGWIAGLQLAALALRSEPNPASFIAQFAGTNRYVMDYLLDEVFRHQPPAVQDFLLKTSILHRLHADLCDEIRQQADSQNLIELLEKNSLFIVALDQSRAWYRYHHLFGDLLMQRLRQEKSHLLPDLHLRAAQWYAKLADAEADQEALYHAFASGDHDFALQFLESRCDAIWERGEVDSLREWLRHLDDEAIRTSPKLALYCGWNAMTEGHYALAEDFLMVASTNPSDLGKVATIRAFIATFQQDFARSIQESETALGQLSKDNSWYSSAAIALGDSYAVTGNIIRARESYENALKSAEKNLNLRLNAAFKLAGMQRQAGDLKAAFHTLSQYIHIAETMSFERSPVAGVLYSLRGDIHAEWQALDHAASDIQRGVENNHYAHYIGFYGWSNLYYARYLRVSGDYEAAESHLQAILNEAKLPAWLQIPYRLTLVQVWLSHGNLAAANTWLARSPITLEQAITMQADGYLLIVARIKILQGQFNEAELILSKVAAFCRENQQFQSLMIAYILHTLVLDAQNQATEALDALSQALSLGETGNYLQIFVDGGDVIAKYLMEAKRRGLFLPYVEKLLTGFATLPQKSMREALSERELEVLRRIAAGLKNQEIAEELVISLNTILYHTKNIYGKLDATNRTQAVQRARELGIL